MLAPTGTLRVGVYLGSPTSLVVDAQGRRAGVALEMGQRLGQWLGVPVRAVEFPRVAEVVVSSVSPTTLLAGKVLGVGAVFSLRNPTPLRLFLIWAFVLQLAIYSWANERFSWLVMHPLLPLILLQAAGIRRPIKSEKSALLAFGGGADAGGREGVFGFAGDASDEVAVAEGAADAEVLVPVVGGGEVPREEVVFAGIRAEANELVAPIADAALDLRADAFRVDVEVQMAARQLAVDELDAAEARGELVALNFDRAWEATINDYAWSPAYSRSIGVDIRYVEGASGADPVAWLARLRRHHAQAVNNQSAAPDVLIREAEAANAALEDLKAGRVLGRIVLDFETTP